MRPLEMLLIIFNILLLGWLIFARNKSRRGLLIGFGMSAILVLLHGLIEDMRWQMIPAYVITLIPVIIFAVRSIFKSKEVKKKAYRLKIIRL